MTITKKNLDILILMLLYFTGFAIRYYTSLHLLISMGMFSLFVPLAFVHAYTTIKSFRIRKLMLTTLFIDVIACIGVIINKNHTLLDCLLLITWQTMGFFLYSFRASLKQFRKFAILMLGILILFEMSTIIRYGHNFDTIPLTPRISRNTISILLLQFFAIDTIWRVNKNTQKPFSRTYLLIVLVACILPGGSGGALMSLLLVAGLYFFSPTNANLRKKRAVRAVFVSVCIALVSFDILSSFFSYIGEGDYLSRFYMWTEYWNLITRSGLNFLFGANISNHIVLSRYGNMHNSLLNWHYYFGLIPTIYMTYLAIVSIRYAFRQRRGIYLSLMIAMLMRMITDDTTYAFTQLWVFFACEALANQYTIPRKTIRFV